MSIHTVAAHCSKTHTVSGGRPRSPWRATPRRDISSKDRASASVTSSPGTRRGTPGG